MRAFVDELTKAWCADDKLGPFYASHSDHQKKCTYKEKLFQFFRYKLDGDECYIGSDLKNVHHPLGITNELFDKSQAHLLQCLKKQRCKPAVFREFIKRISVLRADIVTPPD